MDITQDPFLNVIWTFVVIFAWLGFFWLMISITLDLFRRDDISGWGRGLWIAAVVLLPFLGSLAYLLTQGRSMMQRDDRLARRGEQDFDGYVRTRAGTTGPAADIEKAKELLDGGVIDETEFQQLKTRALI